MTVRVRSLCFLCSLSFCSRVIMCMNSLRPCIHHQSVGWNMLPCKQAGIYPRGYPMSRKSSLLGLNMWSPFVFVGQMDVITCRHLLPSLETPMTIALPLIRPYGYKRLVIILSQTKLCSSPECVTRAAAFCLPDAARLLQHVKFSHHDKQVKSERILRNTARPKPFVFTAFEGCFSRSPCLLFLRQRGGPDYLYHVLGETRLPVSFFFFQFFPGNKV
ncbi:hypothetical protein F5148DRAFT_299317 [Russula earlei]|uniref:Uncharacterized protein n=1 Tax=Russula earlei TaxID=71964 RepID=A0ACC0UII4_9AGAM|nr:hypothetical protein F5148DRAFT_299317 [Russula earlei]